MMDLAERQKLDTVRVNMMSNGIDMTKLKEQWIKWEPLPGLEEVYCIDNFIYTGRGLRIELFTYGKKNNKNVIIFFIGAQAYKFREELFATGTCVWVQQNYGKDFLANWTLFKVENSAEYESVFGKWVDVADDLKSKQYSIFTSEGTLDIYTNCEPIVEYAKP